MAILKPVRPAVDPLASSGDAGSGVPAASPLSAVPDSAIAETGDEEAELVGCKHCGTLVDKTELKPMRGLGIDGCAECRIRLEVVGHHQRPLQHHHYREIEKRLRKLA